METRQVTPSAKRNSYRVAWLVGVATQGSVLRPQPWAMKSQLRQSCRGAYHFPMCMVKYIWAVMD